MKWLKGNLDLFPILNEVSDDEDVTEKIYCVTQKKCILYYLERHALTFYSQYCSRKLTYYKLYCGFLLKRVHF